MIDSNIVYVIHQNPTTTIKSPQIDRDFTESQALKWSRIRKWAAILVACVLAPGAVLCGALHLSGLLNEQGNVVVQIVELAILVLSALLIVLRPFRKPHRGWIASRIATELMRREEWLLKGEIGPYESDPAGAKERRLNHIRDWMLWTVDPRQVPHFAVHAKENEETLGITAIDDPSSEFQWVTEIGQAGSQTLTNATLESYLNDRVRDQLCWYEEKSERLEMLEKVYHGAIVVLLFLAVAISIGGFFLHSFERQFGVLLVWLPAVGGGVIALRSYFGVTRNLRSYNLQIELLTKLEADGQKLLTGPKTPEFAGKAKLVILTGEAIFAREYRRWLLALSPEEPLP